MAGLAFKVIGAIGLASYAAAYVCTKLRYLSYHRFKVVAVPVARLPAMPRGYSARSLGADELARHVIDIGADEQARRFAEGLECLAAFDAKGALAGVSWIGRQAHCDPVFGVCYLLPPGAAWDTGLWVPEDKRMTRAFSAVWAGIGEWLAREDLAWTMSSIADYNISSILSHRRLGARELRSFVVLRLGRLQLTVGARPLLRVRPKRTLPTVRLRLPVVAAA